ncbi:hypothetical protein E2C01_094250 [Portunus trituberculatus]|uniref:Uncharacterized protein n=1 Tax=Portunus trituberculatus TaxID=210409 RepID=A0A5B7JWD5_PORTR|nr:hypothetical protein [Portunus trituberculatus]
MGRDTLHRLASLTTAIPPFPSPPFPPIAGCRCEWWQSLVAPLSPPSTSAATTTTISVQLWVPGPPRPDSHDPVSLSVVAAAVVFGPLTSHHSTPTRPVRGLPTRCCDECAGNVQS